MSDPGTQYHCRWVGRGVNSHLHPNFPHTQSKKKKGCKMVVFPLIDSNIPGRSIDRWMDWQIDVATDRQTKRQSSFFIIASAHPRTTWVAMYLAFFSRMHATLWPTLSVGRSVGRSVGNTLLFLAFLGVFCITAPAFSCFVFWTLGLFVF